MCDDVHYEGARLTGRRTFTSSGDALGLDWLDDQFDDMIADLLGQNLYALGAINEGARAASIGLETTLNIAMGFLPGSGLYDAFNSVQVIASGKGGFFDALNIAVAAFPVAKGLMGLKGLFKARKFRRMACNCFVAGTMVDTPDGAVPLEGLEEGDEVITRHQGCPDCPPVNGTVTRVFKSLAPAILWLTLATGDVIGATPGHEVWTHQDGWGTAAGLAVGDTFTDRAGNPVEIIDIRLDPTPTPVYNLEVDGTFTYFANGVWVHNNSCARAAGRIQRHHALPKFLGGRQDGFFVGIPARIHGDFHRMLSGELRNFGVRRGSASWREFFERFPNQVDSAIDALLVTNSRFWERYGYGVSEATIQQLIAQGF
ncbi:MAG: Hint domain-containing protein [Planctomycetes bacterium]|nr:Hint domain-containing protein [Planctomycetota bacterium]